MHYSLALLSMKVHSPSALPHVKKKVNLKLHVNLQMKITFM